MRTLIDRINYFCSGINDGVAHLLLRSRIVGGYPLGTVNNTAFAIKRALQVFWTGAKYAATSDLDLIAAYYHDDHRISPYHVFMIINWEGSKEWSSRCSDHGSVRSAVSAQQASGERS